MRPCSILLGWLFPFCLSAQERSPVSSLPLPRDTTAIDSLNARSFRYNTEYILDSAVYYAEAAYRASEKIHYIHGLAEALAAKALIEEHFYNNFPQEGRLAGASFRLYQQTGNKGGLKRLYPLLAFSLFAQGEYDSASKIAGQAYTLSRQQKDPEGITDALAISSVICVKQGQFDKAFDLIIQGQQIAIATGDSTQVKGYQLALGEICMEIEDYPQALQYFRAGYTSFNRQDSLAQARQEYNVWGQMEFAEIYAHLNRFDSALYRYNLFDTARAEEKDLRVFLVSKGEYFMLTGQYDQALPSLLRGLQLHLKRNDRNEIMRTYLDVARTFQQLDREKDAEKYARLALAMALPSKAGKFIRDAYKLLFTAYSRRGLTDSAYRYYRSYIEEKEAVTDDQTRGKMAAYNYERKISLLNSEKLIGEQKLKIREQQLRNETFLRNVVISLIFVLLVVGFLLIRNNRLQRKNEQLRNESIQKELLHRSTEMEMQALRAQMNPHFVFNCLNSINRFIMKNEPQAASDYLTRFSRLMRMVLNNSKRSLIPLEDEIDMLRLYLDMEKLRFKDAFDYHICYEEDLEPSLLFIPPLLLQPFVENAVWHGLVHKKSNGLVTLSFSREGPVLICEVIDNGIGRAAAAKARSRSSGEHKSFGIQITRERLAHINGNMETEMVSFLIEDLFDTGGQAAGTRVSLKIRYRKNMQTTTETLLKTDPV